MKRFSFVVFLLLSATSAAAQDVRKLAVEKLIDRLTALDAAVPGIDASGLYDAFLALDETPKLRMGLLPAHRLSIPAPMRELVRRGAGALPALLAHLGDARPTGIVISQVSESMTVGGNFFADEYDPRGRSAQPDSCAAAGTCRRFDGTYTVKVGDVCEVLIGQIVNRRLDAVRYQPSWIVYVNSPVETPPLAQRIRKDWDGLDANAHRKSLLFDLRSADDMDGWHGYRDALLRLRFYHPRAYARLRGADLRKREDFEAGERKRLAGH